MNNNNRMEIEGNSWYYSRFQNLVFDDSNLEPKAKLVYCVICKFADNQKQTAFPSIKTIAKQAGYSSKNTVLKAIRKLVDAGYILKTRRTDKKGRDTSNLYEIKDIRYIYDLIKYAKDNKNKQLLNAINSRLNKHPIPTYDEIMNLYAKLKKEEKEKKQKSELEKLYEEGYR